LKKKEKKRKEKKTGDVLDEITRTKKVTHCDLN
jgi:hypothetical protein